ncbi:MAG TPA: DNA primase [Acidimicrobiales bacterium]|nr:DNA primase [Acidimicrobiales bacterium]
MGIVEEDIARVRAATDIVALIGEYVQLRQVGSRWRGLCPFHTEKTGSFYVNAVDGLYHCFGCQASGDAITFIREQEHLDFPQAVERLAAKVGITLTYDKPGESRTRAERRRLADVVAAAEDWYHERLLSAPDAAAARKYLRDRGFDGDEVREWKIGWAPDDWDQLARGLRLSMQDAEGTGLGRVNSRGRVNDFFRGRVLFPIHDADGTPLGFGGRILPGVEGSKYVNTPQTRLYDKSRVLFALDRAKTGIVQADEVVVCEGYTDVTAFFRVGVPRAVATCGTALTDEHVQLLRRFARRVVLAFDADAAGQAAADRFYQWESRFDLDVVVAAMPPGVDPADLARSSPESLVAAVEGARPFLEFRLGRILDGADLTSAEHRARAAEEALGVIAEHPNDLVRDQYLMQVADRCRLDVDRLRQRVARGDVRRPTPPEPARRRRDERAGSPVDEEPGPRAPDPDGDPGPVDPGRPAGGGGPAPSRDSSPAVEVLRLAVNRPEEVVDWLDECLFDEPLHRDTFRALVSSATIHEAIETSPPDVAAFLSRLAVEEPVDDPLDPVLLQVRSTGKRLLAEERAKPEPDLDRLATLARLVDRTGSPTEGLDAARELLTLASRTGGSS